MPPRTTILGYDVPLSVQIAGIIQVRRRRPPRLIDAVYALESAEVLGVAHVCVVVQLGRAEH